MRRLREAPTQGDRFEPALTLAMATGWLEAGMPEESQRALVALKERRPTLTPTMGGRQVAWFDKDADAVAWLRRVVGPGHAGLAANADRWLMYRGDATGRNVAAIGGPPLFSMCWRIPRSPTWSTPPTSRMRCTSGEITSRRRAGWCSRHCIRWSLTTWC